MPHSYTDVCDTGHEILAANMNAYTSITHVRADVASAAVHHSSNIGEWQVIRVHSRGARLLDVAICTDERHLLLMTQASATATRLGPPDLTPTGVPRKLSTTFGNNQPRKPRWTLRWRNHLLQSRSH